MCCTMHLKSTTHHQQAILYTFHEKSCFLPRSTFRCQNCFVRFFYSVVQIWRFNGPIYNADGVLRRSLLARWKSADNMHKLKKQFFVFFFRLTFLKKFSAFVLRAYRRPKFMTFSIFLRKGSTSLKHTSNLIFALEIVWAYVSSYSHMYYMQKQNFIVRQVREMSIFCFFTCGDIGVHVCLSAMKLGLTVSYVN